MMPRPRYSLIALVASAVFGLNCTSVLGVDTAYEENDCTAKQLPPNECGQGACRVLSDACVNGLPVECKALTGDAEEVCNDGIDNNCDGNVDEGCDCTTGGDDQVCYNGSTATRNVGLCRDGTQTCANGAWAQCLNDVRPTEELCDKVDNDCDGSVDEGCSCTENQEQTCYGGPDGTVEVGPCRSGVQKCQEGKWGKCEGDIIPGLEECNGADDDCDGQLDNGCPCVHGEFVECYDGPPVTRKKGECKDGLAKCENGQLLSCEGQVLPKIDICNQSGQQLDEDCDGDTNDIEDSKEEVCDGVDNNCNGKIDESDPVIDMPCDTGKPGPCKDGKYSCDLTLGKLKCNSNQQSSNEVCDGIDNDCNGAIDDSIQNPGDCIVPGLNGVCANGKYTCELGVKKCEQTVNASVEICDDLDNDCDGTINDGDPQGGGVCNTGLFGVCKDGIQHCINNNLACTISIQPATLFEACDGLDNDCDGNVDDGNPGGGGPCNIDGQIGQCAIGVIKCQGGNLDCAASFGQTSEICDNLDNDCNGIKDDGDPGGGAGCLLANLLGECAKGKEACIGGVILCDQKIQPESEKCDGLDNNCNGMTDEGDPGGGLGCNTGGFGICDAGTLHCNQGTLGCQQILQPQGEICDNVDNDCDGTVDDGNPGGGAACQVQGNLGVCLAGAYVCQGGSLVCNANNLPSAELCDNLDNDCDGSTDEGNPEGGAACTTNLQGVCSPGTNTCIAGNLVCVSNVVASGELCDGQDNDCDGSIDEGNPGGGASCPTGLSGICAQGTQTCTGANLVCIPNLQPASELCDGIDQNCNGLVDDGVLPGVGNACPTGKQGICAQGTYICQAGSLLCQQNVLAFNEVCDGQDNNCDGAVDELNPGGGAICSTQLQGVCDAGTMKCQGGVLSCSPNLLPSNEVCDGKDNNCNGIVDDGALPQVGDACSTGLAGVCNAGLRACISGNLSCAQSVPSSPEVCDGLDNNCNGAIDEGALPQVGDACPTQQLGVCSAGSKACQNGQIKCAPNVPASAEECDGLDNDCDGAVDEGNLAQVGDPCLTGINGVCSQGSRICQGGNLLCQQNTPSSAEVCNGLDDDCNGMTDEGMLPGVNTPCTSAQQGVCAAGTNQCQGGALICQSTLLPSGEICDNLDNDCDGMVDDGNPGGGGGCSSGALGICEPGTFTCTGGSIVCLSNVLPNAQPEICDGLDNNCNGSADEGNPQGGAACPSGAPGVCGPGTLTCLNGALGCVSNIMPGAQAEACDNLDNDCDGTVDDGNPGGGAGCTSTNPGICAPGTVNCIAGGLSCQSTILPGSQSETCNALDDNCDGAKDEGFGCCPDGIKDGTETGVDCGGPSCAVKCAPGQSCTTGSDCTSGVCTALTCQPPLCGDGVKNGADVCDDGNLVNGDGCNSTCAPESGYSCTPASPSVCSPVCGDQYVRGSEQCDDGNNVPADGCSPTCTWEVLNESGDFGDNAGGAATILLNQFAAGTISTMGMDKDWFQFPVSATPVTLRIETFDSSAGTNCVGIDTTVNVYKANGTTLMFTSTNDGIGNCSAMVVELSNAVPSCNGASCFIEVTGANGNNYKLQVKEQKPSAAESEMNGTTGSANEVPTPPGSDVYVSGTRTPNDSDYFAVFVPQGKSIRAEVLQSGGICSVKNPRLTLYNPVGTQLVQDDDEAFSSLCPMIDGTGSSPLDAAAGNLPAGTYFLHVDSSDNTASGPGDFSYQLAVTVR